jgi:hypothetical protein
MPLDMRLPALQKIRRILIPATLALAMLLMPTSARVANARVTRVRLASDVIVDIHVTVHNSDIGVSKEVLDAAVEHVLEEAHIKCEVEQADSVAVQLKIDIYREDSGHFKIDGDLSGPPDEVENGEDKEEKECAAQDDIDDMVIAIVHDFVHFIHHA